MKYKFMQLLVLCGVMLCTHIASANFRIVGKAQYTRNWQPANAAQYNYPGSLTPSSSWGGVHPVKRAKICAQNAAGTFFCNDPVAQPGKDYSDDSGNFDISINNSNPGTGWKLIVRWAIKQQASSAEGPRIVTSDGGGAQQSQLGATFTPPTQGSSINLGTRTFTPCSPAAANCDNDRANGFAVLQYMERRWVANFAGITGFNSAVDGVTLRTDNTSTSKCAFANANGVCCNFDFADTEIGDCFHEAGHMLWARWRGDSIPGLTGCASENSARLIAAEFEANLNHLLMVYPEANLTTVTNLHEFCSAVGGEPDGSTPTQSCATCEFTPHTTQYPLPNACGTSTTNNVRRTECRALRMAIDMLDSTGSNGSSCLTESMNKTWAEVAVMLKSLSNGSGEGQTNETTLGSPAQGNAAATHDAFSTMDMLLALPGGNIQDKWNIWQNACSMPGDGNWPANTFLPGNADPPPF